MVDRTVETFATVEEGERRSDDATDGLTPSVSTHDGEYGEPLVLGFEVGAHVCGGERCLSEHVHRSCERALGAELARLFVERSALPLFGGIARRLYVRQNRLSGIAHGVPSGRKTSL
jgi:hypothetical protein